MLSNRFLKDEEINCAKSKTIATHRGILKKTGRTHETDDDITNVTLENNHGHTV
jgi:hypothetical protein